MNRSPLQLSHRESITVPSASIYWTCCRTPKPCRPSQGRCLVSIKLHRTLRERLDRARHRTTALLLFLRWLSPQVSSKPSRPASTIQPVLSRDFHLLRVSVLIFQESQSMNVMGSATAVRSMFVVIRRKTKNKKNSGLERVDSGEHSTELSHLNLNESAVVQVITK